MKTTELPAVIGEMAAAEVDPRAILHFGVDGRHTYRAGRAPAHLGTRRQLRAAGLSAAGLAAAGWLHYSPLHGICALYDRRAARPVRALTERQRQALAAGRAVANTAACRRCDQVRVPWWPSWAKDLGVPLCDPCRQAREVERAAAREQRARNFAERIIADQCAAARWAVEVLADPSAVVLDTETTGLRAAFMVEVAVVAVDGTVLLDTLVDPRTPIPAETTAIHGISDEMVHGAPRFAELLPRLAEVLAGRRVVIYNADFDTGIIANELCRLWCGPGAHDLLGGDWSARRLYGDEACRERLDGWLATVPARIECAMTEHARWYGDWSGYWGDYTWQPLRGGHRAAGDCRAVIERLREMAALVQAADSRTEHVHPGRRGAAGVGVFALLHS